MRPGFGEYETGGALLGTEWSDTSSEYKVMRLIEAKDTLENEVLHYPELMVREIVSDGYNEVRRFRVAEFVKVVESRGEESLAPVDILPRLKSWAFSASCVSMWGKAVLRVAGCIGTEVEAKFYSWLDGCVS